MTKKRRILSTFLAASMVTACMAGMSTTASADPVGSTYTVTIPSTLTVANSGWNSIGDISASGTLEDGKKLNITATSLNNFALMSGANSVTYKIKNASTDTKATTSWDFTKEQLTTGATQAIGIDVSDYSTKPAGTYTDTVTFTATVVDPPIAVNSISLNETSLDLTVGGDTATLTATVDPDTASVTWASDKESVATVGDGVVTPGGIGTATITATAGTKNATCTVTINKIKTPGRGETVDVKIPGASADNPVYFTGAYTGSVTSETVAYSHSYSGSHDDLYFNGTRIYHGSWDVGSALQITGGTGTQSDPYVITRD